LAIILLIARIAQSVLHIGPSQTELVAGARFGFYAIQIACMIIMGSWAAAIVNTPLIAAFIRLRAGRDLPEASVGRQRRAAKRI
jgi:hypothetical protein